MAKREMKTVKTEEVNVEEMINETVAPEVEEKVEEVTPKSSFGIVTGCSKLNVRVKPNIKATVASVIDANTEVIVNLDESTKDWYKVMVKGVNDGFCMKKFITIKK